MKRVPETNVRKDARMDQEATSPISARAASGAVPGESEQRASRTVAPPAKTARRFVVSAILLDALRGARTYVQHYKAGRGAE